MANQLYNSMQTEQNSIIQRFQQFKNSFKGDPQQQIQQMLNSGKITQQQYNQAVKMANQFQRILNGV